MAQWWRWWQIPDQIVEVSIEHTAKQPLRMNCEEDSEPWDRQVT